MLAMINSARSQSGATPLTLSNNLAAQHHAEDLMRHCLLSHTGSDGSTLRERYDRAGGRRFFLLGENVNREGFCPIRRANYVRFTLEQLLVRAHEGLMGSPGHRRNILDPGYDEVALGFARDHPNFWVVQVFIGR